MYSNLKVIETRDDYGDFNGPKVRYQVIGTDEHGNILALSPRCHFITTAYRICEQIQLDERIAATEQEQI